MATEILLIGSNVDRERSVAAVLDRLLDLAEPVRISRIVETPPVGLVDGGPSFLNLAAAIDWSDSTAALKTRLVDIEVALGRNRRDAHCWCKSRSADIDPVLRLTPGATQIDPSLLPCEQYARGVVLDLLASLGVTSGAASALSSPVVEIAFCGTRLGRTPAVLTRVSLARAR